jgi:hypothetical protein
MKISEIFAMAALAAVAALLTPPVWGQTTSAPIVVKSSTSDASKPGWMNAEVIHADSNSMIVREQANGMMIHTFTYTPALQAQMAKLVQQGGYQYGDKVKILHQPGQTVALRLAGAPSKSQ